jgi:integrase
MGETIRFGSRGQGSLIKFDGSANWHSRYSLRGKECVQSTGTPDLKLAKRIHRQRLDELAADRQGYKRFLPPMVQRVTIREIFADLETDFRLRKVKSLPQVRSHLKPVLEHFGEWRALDVTAEAVDAFIEAQQEDDKASATINRSLQLLVQAMRLAVSRHKLTSVPSIRHLREDNTRQGFLEKDEVDALVAALPPHLQDVVTFGYFTGWRRGEILGLTWDDVDRDGNLIRLPGDRAKNGRPRSVPIEGEELQALMDRRFQARLVEQEDGVVKVVDHVFHKHGRPIGDFRKPWVKACIKAGLFYVVKDENGQERKVPEKLFHDLRRSAVRNMVRAGVPERVAMEISGHRTRSIFDRYDIVSKRDLEQAMQRTAGYLMTQSKGGGISL